MRRWPSAPSAQPGPACQRPGTCTTHSASHQAGRPTRDPGAAHPCATCTGGSCWVSWQHGVLRGSMAHAVGMDPQTLCLLDPRPTQESATVPLATDPESRPLHSAPLQPLQPSARPGAPQRTSDGERGPTAAFDHSPRGHIPAVPLDGLLVGNHRYPSTGRCGTSGPGVARGGSGGLGTSSPACGWWGGTRIPAQGRNRSLRSPHCRDARGTSEACEPARMGATEKVAAARSWPLRATSRRSRPGQAAKGQGSKEEASPDSTRGLGTSPPCTHGEQAGSAHTGPSAQD